MTSNKIVVFDGHNDTLLDIYVNERGGGRTFLERSEQGHIDLPRAAEGGFTGGFFAIFTPNDKEAAAQLIAQYKDLAESGEMPASPILPPAVSKNRAARFVMGMAARLFRIEKEAAGRAKVVRTAAELAACLDAGILAMIFHIEGAEAIDENLDALHVLYQAGLRSLGIVWSRPNIFGHGVPFTFPGSPDQGDGLTDAGIRLVKTCNELGIMLDLSHLNEKGFWDVAKYSDAPLVATHSNAHALCPSPRNLTDKQLDAIAETGGVVGINFHRGFLREDGDQQAETSLSEIVRHAAYIAARIGVKHVALGSDFDGAAMPQDLGDVTGLPKLMTAFQEHGFTEGEVDMIAHKNWLHVLRKTWKT